ncbi:hypothetical protein AWC02_01850 [Mycolicibacter engbaekii]|uniref:Uncharacterized protein n=1 Tax=Mycolicibacter engbaekii TaxID=188915 RepID=A0A1X1U9G5_9MYCO|nr:hypothetical protein [Mycolicibacter engbaekii]ORV53467.1 hypothetical protein AWC02_01850 [Mycolicibacter engbaekii]
MLVSTPVAVNASGLANYDITLTADAQDLGDPFGVIQHIFEESEHQFSTGFEYVSLGELALGASQLAAGFANAFVYAPLAGALTVFDAAVGQDPVWLSVPDFYFLAFDLEDTFEQVDYMLGQAFDQIAQSFDEFAAGDFNLAAASLAYGFTNIFTDIPLQLLVGAVSLFDGFDDVDGFDLF